jgi:AdoMet-dependent rRNA methyltransferase SPB1
MSFAIDDNMLYNLSLLKLAETTDEIKKCCEDLKILGKKEFKALLKWRLCFVKDKESNILENTKQQPTIEEEEDDEGRLEQELLSFEKASKAKQRQLKKQEIHQRKKVNSLNSSSTHEEGETANHDGEIYTEHALFSVKSLKTSTTLSDLDVEGEEDEEPMIFKEDEEEDSTHDYDGYIGQMVDRMYEDYKKRRGNRRDDEKLSNKKTMIQKEQRKGDTIEAIATSDDQKTAFWFNQPVFDGVDLSEGGEEDEDGEEDDNIIQDSLISPKSDHDSLKDKKEEASWFEENSDGDSLSESTTPIRSRKLKLTLPEEFALAAAMKLEGRTSEILDTAYNRYCVGADEDLPDWFVEDERQHRVPVLPITKEEVAQYRTRMKEINSRPIKKVAEAKARKKMKFLKKLQQTNQQAHSIANSEDLTEKQKAAQIAKLHARNRKSKKEITYVVAKGANKGSRRRPRGIKGKYKMVDARLKKDTRALKKRKRGSTS